MIINDYNSTGKKPIVTYGRTDHYMESVQIDFRSDALNGAHWEVNNHEYESFSLVTHDEQAITFAKHLKEYTDTPKCWFDSDDSVKYSISFIDNENLIITFDYEPDEMVRYSEPNDGETNLVVE